MRSNYHVRNSKSGGDYADWLVLFVAIRDGRGRSREARENFLNKNLNPIGIVFQVSNFK